MIEKFYSPGVGLDHLRRGALAIHIDGFAGLLAHQGYATPTARLKIRLVADLSNWLDRSHFDVGDLLEDQIQEFLKARKKQSLLRRGDSWTLTQLLAHLRREGTVYPQRTSAVATPIDRITRAYADFLIQERGLRPATLANYVPVARRFLEAKFGAGKLFWNKLHLKDVTEFVVRRSSTGSPKRAQTDGSALRSFLGFLTKQGEVSASLAASVPTVANWRLAELPQFLQPAEVEKLLRSCDRKTATGRRDYALLLLLARLGLRAGEVVHLTLESINWAAGEVLIHGKSAREDRLPLPPDVGRALATYIRRDRPACSSRRVFIRMKAPRQGFANSVAVCTILKRALRRAELHPQKMGAHLLRRSLATKMLRRGASLAQIGEVLRHQLAQTTEIYAKVDLAALRPLAQPWPGGAR